VNALGWYCSVYFWLLLTGIGLPPCPEEAGIIYAAGLTTLHPEVRWWLAWPATMAGIVSADMVLYGVGRGWGPRLFEMAWIRRIVPPEKRARIQGRFEGHGLKILLTARLLPPLRTGVFIIAGAVHYPFWRFLIADGCYAIFGVGLFFFGSAGLIELFRRAGHWLAYVGALALAAIALYRYFVYLRKRELRTKTGIPPVSILQVRQGGENRPRSGSQEVMDVQR
jgi:membrane protein DedA with SNARE-associated domain